MFHLVYVAPEIPGNTGAAIRLAACTGATLHLVRPLGFNFDDANLRRAGLDYHDLANLKIYDDFEDAMSALPGRVFAFTGHTENRFSDVAYQPGDILLFGRESVGLPDEILTHPRITQQVRIPMLASRRSLNLTNSASIAVYEAWRQNGYAGGV